MRLWRRQLASEVVVTNGFRRGANKKVTSCRCFPDTGDQEPVRSTKTETETASKWGPPITNYWIVSQCRLPKADERGANRKLSPARTSEHTKTTREMCMHYSWGSVVVNGSWSSSNVEVGQSRLLRDRMTRELQELGFIVKVYWKNFYPRAS